MQGIYCIENIATKRKYYGSSMDVHKRLQQHQKDLLKGRHCNIHLQRSFNKNKESFVYYLVEETMFDTRKMLLEYEQTFIDRNNGGYNIAPANGGDIMSSHPDREVIISKIRKTVQERMLTETAIERKLKYGNAGKKNGMFGRAHSAETRAKIGNINKGNSYSAGRKMSDEQRAKLSKHGKERTSEKNAFYGKHHTEKTKAILREKMSGENSWIKGIDPSKLSYTKQYLVEYPNGDTKLVYGLKFIAEEFNTSIPNLHAAIARMSRGAIPTRGALKGTKITVVAV